MYKFRQLKPKGRPVTLIVGIICKDGIVLAADSQTTSGMAKIPGTQKISVVEFANGNALVAESGVCGLSNRAIQLFQKKAIGVQIENDETVAKLAEESVREIRSSLVSLHPDLKAPEEWVNFFTQQTNYFELMVAYYWRGKPCLYKFNPLWCIPVPATSYFMTSGVASDLANYILREHTTAQMDTAFATVIAIKVIEDAIEYVEACGGPPRAALIRSPASEQGLSILPQFRYPKQVVIFPDKEVEEIAQIIASVEGQAKSTQNEQIHQMLRERTDKLFKAFFED